MDFNPKTDFYYYKNIYVLSLHNGEMSGARVGGFKEIPDDKLVWVHAPSQHMVGCRDLELLKRFKEEYFNAPYVKFRGGDTDFATEKLKKLNGGVWHPSVEWVE